MKSEPARAGPLEHGSKGIYDVERCLQAATSEATADQKGLVQWFSTFVKLRPGKFSFFTRRGPSIIYARGR